MSHRNESFISVPPNVEQPIVLKRFISTLVEKLDQVFGHRGGDTYASASSLATVSRDLVSLESQIATAVEEALEEATRYTDEAEQDAISAANQYADENFTNNPQQSAIADLSYSAVTVSGTYTQSEVQQIADDLESTSDKLDVILQALRDSNIIGV